MIISSALKRAVFLSVNKPLIKRQRNAAAMVGWNLYLWPLLLNTDIDMSTVIISLKSLLPGPEDPAKWWSYAMASSFIVMLQLVVIILLLLRWFARGLINFGRLRCQNQRRIIKRAKARA